MEIFVVVNVENGDQLGIAATVKDAANLLPEHIYTDMDKKQFPSWSSFGGGYSFNVK